MKTQKSFTLIELLVVIAVIGLLSSIVLVNLKGTRGKARIAKGLEFSQSIQHALGSEAVGIWRFEEATGNTAYDSSGYGNNGTINGASPVAGILGNALSFDGNNDYVDCGSNDSLNIINEISIELWFNPSTVTDDHYAAAHGSYGGMGWAIYQQSTRFTPSIKTNVGTGIVSTSYFLKIGQWGHIVITYDGSKLKVYENGVFYQDAPLSGSILYTGFPKTGIGGYLPTPTFRPFFGLIDEVRIYGKALTAGEIQKHYVEGLERYQDLSIK